MKTMNEDDLPGYTPPASPTNQSDSDLSISSGDNISLHSLPTNHAETPTRCRWQSCNSWFDKLDDLSSHVSSVHANVGKGGLFYCKWENCIRTEKGFNARYKMLVHVRTHTNEKPHQCCQCNKSFSRAENLKIHERTHTGERPYICSVPGCGKAYSNSSDRFKHSKTHENDKPYVCKIPGCSKRYTDPSSLRKHVKTYRHFPVQVNISHETPIAPANPSNFYPEISIMNNNNILSSPVINNKNENDYLNRNYCDANCSKPSPTTVGHIFKYRLYGWNENQNRIAQPIIYSEQDKPLDLSIVKMHNS